MAESVRSANGRRKPDPPEVKSTRPDSIERVSLPSGSTTASASTKPDSNGFNSHGVQQEEDYGELVGRSSFPPCFGAYIQDHADNSKQGDRYHQDNTNVLGGLPQNQVQGSSDLKGRGELAPAGEVMAMKSSRLPEFKDQVRPSSSALHDVARGIKGQDRQRGQNQTGSPEFKDQVRPYPQRQRVPEAPPRRRSDRDPEDLDDDSGALQPVVADLVERPVLASIVHLSPRRRYVVGAIIGLLVVALAVVMAVLFSRDDGGGSSPGPSPSPNPEQDVDDDSGFSPSPSPNPEQTLRLDWVQLGNWIGGSIPRARAGQSVALTSNGSILALGEARGGRNESGLVRAFIFNGTYWEPIGQPIEGKTLYDRSGGSVALSSTGFMMAVGSEHNPDHKWSERDEIVRMFRRDGGAWVPDGNNIVGNTGVGLFEIFGWSIALSSLGETVAIGAPVAVSGDDEFYNPGLVRVFRKPSFLVNTWTQVGDDIPGENPGDNFGHSVSISEDGNIVAVGAVENRQNGRRAGQVRVHQLENDTWTQMGQIIYGEEGEFLGGCVSLSGKGNILAVGSEEYSGPGLDAGRLRIFQYLGQEWKETSIIERTGAGNTAYLGFSCSISQDGSRVSVSAPGATVNGTAVGLVQSFDLDGSTWKQVGSDLVGDNAGDQFGFSVDLSKDGSTVAVGANMHASNGEASGRVSVYRLTQLS